MKTEGTLFTACLSSPLGELGLVWSGGARPLLRRLLLPRIGLAMAEQIGREYPGAVPSDQPEKLAAQVRDLAAGRRTDLAGIALALDGLGAFAQRVMAACRAIPHGRVASYGELALAAGFPGAARAVGGVMASNPLALCVPCHRVVRGDGSLGGFGGEGPAMKRALLEAEGVRFDKRDRVLPAHRLTPR